MGSVTFNYSEWSTRYPEFSTTVTQALAQLYFNEAGLYLNNTDASPVTDFSAGGQRDLILNMITSHIAFLNAGTNGAPASPLVGRVGSVAEGSVTVQATFEAPGTAQWFAQSKYGAAAWQAMAQYRTANYVSRYGDTAASSPGLPTGFPYWPAEFRY